MKKRGDDIIFILKQQKGAKGTVKEVRAQVDAKTYTPKSLRLKVLSSG